MGYVPSATTVTATAYLTDRGRELLFNKGNIRFTALGDLFEVKTFSLSDQDINYNTGVIPESGSIPDATGENEGCLKTTSNLTQQKLIFYDVDNLTAGGTGIVTTNPQYTPVSPQTSININTLL